jgi:hypothetical protein
MVPEMVPQRLDEIIITTARGRYCIVRKADIPNCCVHAVASYVRFHSRDNRLKGDRRGRRRVRTQQANFAHLEN